MHRHHDLTDRAMAPDKSNFFHRRIHIVANCCAAFQARYTLWALNSALSITRTCGVYSISLFAVWRYVDMLCANLRYKRFYADRFAANVFALASWGMPYLAEVVIGIHAFRIGLSAPANLSAIPQTSMPQPAV